MKNKLIVVALIAVILAAGMVLVSCGGCPGDGKCSFDGKTAAAGIPKYCGTSVKDQKDVDKALECAIIKGYVDAALNEKKLECDC